MPSLWNLSKVRLQKLLDFGINDLTPHRERRNIKLSNNLLAVVTIIVPLYGILYACIGYYGLALSTAFVTAGFQLCIFLNYKYKTTASRLLFITIANLAVLLYSLTLGHNSGLPLAFFSIFIIPFVVFDFSKTKALTAGIAICTTAAIGYEIFGRSLPPIIILDDTSLKILHLALLLTVIFVLGWAITWMYINNSRSEDALLDLQEKQIGDYYLTHLIAEPLLRNGNHSDCVNTAFLVRQKKQFQFKNWAASLGGDLCITGNLSFWNRPHTFFINADAMGKSMQGAGGAIVLGTAVNARLTQAGSQTIDTSPRKWLSGLFSDLHKIFLSFDGSMMISATIGLIDDSSGLLYYFCAEHPPLLLARDKNHQYLPYSHRLYKIGSPVQSELVIAEFQLYKDDVLLVGSDGKDDLNLQPGYSEVVVNGDENMFLNIVKQSGTDLTALYNALGDTGEIIDDVSLLKIEFSGPVHGLEKPLNGKELFSKVAYLVQCQDYLGALTLMGANSRTKSGPDLLYWRAYCLERLGRGAEAIPILRKALLLSPYNKAASELLNELLAKAGLRTETVDDWVASSEQANSL